MVFNNAAIFEVVSFADVAEESLSKMVDVNFMSPVYCFKCQVLRTRDFAITCTAARFHDLCSSWKHYTSLVHGSVFKLHHCAVETNAAHMAVNGST